jgi:hypothetical protein
MDRTTQIVVLLACLLAAAGLEADDGRIEIGPTDTFPIVIRGPGSFILTTDLSVDTEDVNAIEISWPHNVTLDLGGHTISGPGAGTGVGIEIPGGHSVSSVRVLNGVVTRFRYGVQLTSTSVGGGNIIENISATYNLRDGILASKAVIIECSTHGNEDDGIDASWSVIRDCVSTANEGNGIYSWAGVVHGCVANGNDEAGILLGGKANQIAFSTVAYNGGYGIDMAPDGSNNVSHCSGSDNDAGNITNCHAGNGCHHNYLP